ncbi:MAG TPA: hypothetical protein VL242_06875 [Sorangium sp.]|nr:hypothetical protein [Sorangium sp.]
MEVIAQRAAEGGSAHCVHLTFVLDREVRSSSRSALTADALFGDCRGINIMWSLSNPTTWDCRGLRASRRAAASMPA